jgi:hypothetical protein
MLSKLLKHEFTATWKVPVALDALLIVLGIMAYFVITGIPMVESTGVYILLFALIGIYYIGIIAANIIMQVYIVMRYHKNLYTEEGYLTFTLPVTTNSIINAKVIVGYVWEILSLICTLGSLFIAASGVLNSVDVSSAELQEFANELMSIFGVTDPRFITAMILTVVISPLSSLLALYFSVTVGQLWQKHKILGAVFCYIGLYILNQIIGQVSLFSSGFYGLMGDAATEFDSIFSTIYASMLTTTAIVQGILAVVYYVACIMITKKKINLD